MAATFLVMLFALEETKFESSTIYGRRLSRTQPTEAIGTQKESGSKVEQCRSTTSSCLERQLDNSIASKSYWKWHALYTRNRDSTIPYSKQIWRQLYRPFYILAIFPACMFSALQYAWSESMLSFLAITQATLYPLPPYNFSSIGIGNMNIPPAIGAILGSLFGVPLSDYMILAIAKRRGGIFEPEYRLWTFMVPGLSMVIGVLMYGLTVAEVRTFSALGKEMCNADK